MVDTTLLVAWRAWYARNEVTRDKALPPTKGSVRFLGSYLNRIRTIKTLPVKDVLKAGTNLGKVGTGFITIISILQWGHSM